MSNVKFLFVIMTFVSLSSCKRNNSSNQQVESDNQPSMDFEKYEHDFESIAYKSDASYFFTFRNSGEAPLTIKNVKSSCGCTVPKWSKKPILSGEQGSIRVKYDTRRKGRFRKTITVYSNASNSPVVLTIKGSVAAE
jgi:hypothetical protein